MTTPSTPRRQPVAGLARLISLVATVVFISIALLGLNFFVEGRLVATAVVGIPAAALLLRALTTMSRCKATRQGGRRTQERLATLAALTLMGLGSLFVSKFVAIVAMRHELRVAMSETIVAMSTIDADYRAYADARIAAAPRRLRSTLTLILRPDGEAGVWEMRHDWLDGLKDDDVWNIFMPANARALHTAATLWTEEYVKISAVILRDEPDACAPFARDDSSSRLDALLAHTRTLSLPDAKGAAASAALIALMLLNYAVVRRSTADYEGTHR